MYHVDNDPNLPDKFRAFVQAELAVKSGDTAKDYNKAIYLNTVLDAIDKHRTDRTALLAVKDLCDELGAMEKTKKDGLGGTL